jgi:hypothetical protein
MTRKTSSKYFAFKFRFTRSQCDASWDTFGEKDSAGARRFIAYKSHSALRIKLQKAMRDVNTSKGY